ncbi:Protein of unknown function (DUF2808) [Synechococcus sp. PCC 7502]|uniref:DUF2808 domain-containing protein n=1 Tax=Synechococcus sp. PCC 7502 TaxID=1173263 RepID=UPI00029F90F9|nr:DUF2808 domain-containing protein [Synechococcus sp. PCC 7502]AFY75256.1 Protein of unknown function (DUF2808) [Synechococcus sp. PCC 7502]
MSKRFILYSCCLALGITSAAASLAQTGSGIVLFGNVRDSALSYRLDGGRARQIDRYYLDIPAQKTQISQVIVTYRDNYDGEIDPQSIDLRYNDRNLDLEKASWDKENRRIEVVTKEPIPAGRALKLVLSNVRNPFYAGLYQFDARVMGPAELPLLRYVGSWVIGFE